MKARALAICIGIVFGVVTGLASAHDHPPPITCAEFCGDDACRCWKKCEALGGDNWPAPSECTVECNAIADQCEKNCGT